MVVNIEDKQNLYPGTQHFSRSMLKSNMTNEKGWASLQTGLLWSYKIYSRTTEITFLMSQLLLILITEPFKNFDAIVSPISKSINNGSVTEQDSDQSWAIEYLFKRNRFQIIIGKTGSKNMTMTIAYW